MTKNVTLRLNEDLLRAAKHRAVEEDVSLSRWIANVVEKEVGRRESFAKCRERALARLEKGYHLGGKPLTREQMHER